VTHSRSSGAVWLHRYAVLTAATTLALVGIGGVVTSRGVGMSVPDWPTTYGYNMFFFPFSKWVGGIFYEHSHRLIASFVGLLVVGMTRWLGGRRARLPLALIGAAEILGGLALLRLGTDWKGAGHFLSGIGGVVLAGAAVWTRNEPAKGMLPTLGWLAFWGVQVQGLLGGLRVVLFKDQIGIFHATLAQLFFVLTCVIALMTSRWWGEFAERFSAELARARQARGLAFLFAGTTALILGQLILGATMRHEHAGLAIPDFPLAYGKLWPATDADSIARYNQHRLEVTAVKDITASQIILQMTHRLVAGLILAGVTICAWRTRKELPGLLARFATAWLALLFCQVLLGAATIWSDKAADIATAHVVVGALSLAVGGLLSIVSFRIANSATQPVPATAAAAWPTGSLVQPSASASK
jgi:cytochrome c oxidase assembly protein subunit 15